MGTKLDLVGLRNKYGLSQQDLAEATGISKGTIAKWETRDNIPKVESYEVLKKFFEDKSNQTYTEQRRDKKLNDSPSLDYYEVGASAGTITTAEILPVKKSEGRLMISDLFKGSQFAIRISGNSMTPNYPSGAIIGIREVPDKQITPGSVYVIEKENDLWIKRLFYKNDNQETGFYECVSDNSMKYESGPREGKYFYPKFEIGIDQVRRLFKVTGIYKANELTVIN